MPATPAASADQPLDEFAHCHEGILHKLDELGRLPALLAPAAEARRIAAEALTFFESAVLQHHAEEERELFPAVLASATQGDERDHAQALVERLVKEHREVERTWQHLKPQIKAVAQGQDVKFDAAALTALVASYQSHARFEEAQLLPLAKQILGRNDNHMAALGMSLHLRRALPGVMERFGHRV